jgi:hypothetical protein
MVSIRHILFGLFLLTVTLSRAQSKWDSYDAVLKAMQNGEIALPETDNFKITIGASLYPVNEVATDKAWVYYLIKWKLNAAQASMGFVLRDTFHSALDGASVTMLGSSNNYQLSNNGKQIFSWSLFGALTDAGDTKEGHVYFKVKLKPDTPANTFVRNTAFLELKDGQVIHTTTAVVQVIGVAKDHEPEFDRPIVFPNPSTGTFTFEHPLLSADDQLQLFDAFGKCHSVAFVGNTCTAPQDSAPGVYQIVFQDAQTGRSFSSKLVIK